MARRRLAVGGAVLGTTAALGLPLGLLWWALAPRPRVTVGRDDAVLPYPVSEANFAVDGYFTIIMLVTGLLCGYGIYLVQFRLAARDTADLRMACLLGMAAGAVLGSVLAWQVGTLIDAGDFRRATEAADPGTVIRSGLTLHALSALTVWPFVAVLQYGLFDAVSLWRGDLPAERRPADPEHADEEHADAGHTAPPEASGEPSGEPRNEAPGAQPAERRPADRSDDPGPPGSG
ncbi:hypothetical protein GCM10027570_35450 [Streptomonospora sediminis]